MHNYVNLLFSFPGVEELFFAGFFCVRKTSRAQLFSPRYEAVTEVRISPGDKLRPENRYD